MTRGFGFAVFEGRKRLIDWGVAHVQENKNAKCLQGVEELLTWYEPAVVVIEDATAEGSRRCPRVQRLLARIRASAEKRKVRTRAISRAEIRAAFFATGAANKDEIASAVAAGYPELGPRLPPRRKCWMSEDDRMSIFDAAALAVTFFELKGKQRRHAVEAVEV
jgi:Holliday junction resolvasome RuvABC endonuclease subunit